MSRISHAEAINYSVCNREIDRRCTCASLIVERNTKIDARCLYCMVQPMREKAKAIITKHCPKCEETLPREAFNVRKRNGIPSLYSWCRECSRKCSKAHNDSKKRPVRRTAAEYKAIREAAKQARINALAYAQTHAHKARP